MGTAWVWGIVVILSIVSIVADLATGGDTIIVNFEAVDDAGTLEGIGRLLLAINTLLVRAATFTISGMPLLLTAPVALIASGFLIWGLVETFGPVSLIVVAVLAFIELLRAIIPGV